jgi:UDP-N-acetylmuramate dehydrogenase
MVDVIIEENKSLVGLQTFGLKAQTKYFGTFDSVQALRSLIEKGISPMMVLGGGSNILFAHHYKGLIMQNLIKGIEVTKHFKQSVHVRTGGGHNWHDFVLWAVQSGYGGVENLSLIPGTVGASPIQNIGAYGVEVKDVFVSCEAINLETGKKRIFRKIDCQFGYRDSIFKREAKGKYVITSVTFTLTKFTHQLKTAYGDVVKQLEAKGAWPKPSIADISEAIQFIRKSKLPDPAQIGNCGSFFKNPEVPEEIYQKIKQRHENAPCYPTTPGMVKVPAGWLIESCGWKGKRVGNTGCYAKQALVIVNYGDAEGAEVLQLVQDIIASVQAEFGIKLEPEVQIV